MNKISRNLGLAGLLALGSSETIFAFNYADQDLLLVFRKQDNKDVIIDLGSVTNYLGHPDGYTKTVSGAYNPSVPTTVYGDLTAGPVFALVASTKTSASQKAFWTTVGDANATPTALSLSTWTQVGSKISNIGRNGNTATASSATNVWVIAGSDKLSYTGIMTSFGVLPLGANTLGGTVTYTVASPIAGTVGFYEIDPSSVSPKPNATQVGSFTMAADGTLTFTAGSGGSVVTINPFSIAGIARNGTVSTVTVPTQAGVNYRLRYPVGGLMTDAISTWTIGTTATGTGSNVDLIDDTTDATRVYAVEAFQ